MSNLERVTVNLTPRTSKALAEACGLTADSKTDVINRAVQVYAYIERIRADGGELVIRQDGKQEVLHLL